MAAVDAWTTNTFWGVAVKTKLGGGTGATVSVPFTKAKVYSLVDK
jgi:hypothetical protein